MFEAYFKARAKAERKRKFAGKETMGEAFDKLLKGGKHKSKVNQPHGKACCDDCPKAKGSCEPVGIRLRSH
tara:strand:- start:632 stop:844 length:213 start_codon:yes stop_codon:yes gene_type:complete